MGLKWKMSAMRSQMKYQNKARQVTDNRDSRKTVVWHLFCGVK
jgi:hypothetical protein